MPTVRGRAPTRRKPDRIPRLRPRSINTDITGWEAEMKATMELVDEHKAVLVALRILEKAAESIKAKDRRASADLESLLDFFKGFVDRCHHGKEEDVLFPELVRRGVKREGGPIGVLLEEHEVGRGHVRAMEDILRRAGNVDGDAASAIGEHAHAYIALLRDHIVKEDTVLFQIADLVVPEDVAARLAEQFEEIERDRVGAGKHEAYHAILNDLKERYGVE
jgi:hemerythrin-like domain-containing protein